MCLGLAWLAVSGARMDVGWAVWAGEPGVAWEWDWESTVVRTQGNVMSDVSWSCEPDAL